MLPNGRGESLIPGQGAETPQASRPKKKKKKNIKQKQYCNRFNKCFTMVHTHTQKNLKKIKKWYHTASVGHSVTVTQSISRTCGRGFPRRNPSDPGTLGLRGRRIVEICPSLHPKSCCREPPCLFPSIREDPLGNLHASTHVVLPTLQ